VTVYVVTQSVHYVSLDSTNPVAPYDSWDTAATNIQDAVDTTAMAGALVLVSNGVYQTGGRVVYGSLTNRVVVDKAVIVQSVNGPAVTIIQGNLIIGDSAVRCVYLMNNTTLSGFTLTGGATRNGGDWNQEQCGGGVWCASASAIASNCVIVANSAGGGGGGALSGTFNNCVFTSNSVPGGSGGGAESSALNNCTLTGNSAENGGGADSCTLDNCILTANTVGNAGGGLNICTANNCAMAGNSSAGGAGGSENSTLNNCILTGNSADHGGGSENGILNNCTLSGNSATDGGGAYNSTLNNCLVFSNTADYGGGSEGGILNNCIIVSNSVVFYGGGVNNCILNNCISYYNNGDNYTDSTLNYCCTTPLPDGVGNFTNDPALVDWTNSDFHLQSNSPCINSGNNDFAPAGSDLDGNRRIKGGTVDIGAYEYQTPASMISYAWLQQYGLPTDGTADYTDWDGDGLNNWQEWRTGTDPTNALSVLKMASAAPTNNPPGLIVTWQSVSGITYFLQSSTNLTAQPAFSTIQSNIAGQAGTTSYTDTAATNGGPYFYRVGVQ
jgi:hypothetical protein